MVCVPELFTAQIYFFDNTVVNEKNAGRPEKPRKMRFFQPIPPQRPDF
jgi:hypothetical protein